jgi:hypothetical protein
MWNDNEFLLTNTYGKQINSFPCWTNMEKKILIHLENIYNFFYIE